MAVPAEDIPIIDAHHHFWDLAHPGLKWSWLTDEIENDFFLGNYEALRKTFLPPDYREVAARHNVIGTVHCEGHCDREFQVEESEWLVGLNEKFGLPNAIVAHAWLDRPDTEEVLARQAAVPMVRGIRSKPVTADTPRERAALRGKPGTMQDETWLSGLALFSKYGLSWDLRVPTWHIEEAAEVARAFPDLPINLNHMGFPWDRSAQGLEVWRRGMHALAACPNVVTKLSCLCLRDGPWIADENEPLVRETIDLFGVDRCMFASNFPVDGLRASYDHIYSSFKTWLADFPIEDQQKLLAGNAARFYRIDMTPLPAAA